ncbi:MAG: hypothetical protein ACXVMS_07400 [Flavisolibacter sp.]
MPRSSSTGQTGGRSNQGGSRSGSQMDKPEKGLSSTNKGTKEKTGSEEGKMSQGRGRSSNTGGNQGRGNE